MLIHSIKKKLHFFEWEVHVFSLWIDYPEIKSFCVFAEQEYDDVGNFYYRRYLDSIEFTSIEAEESLFERLVNKPHPGRGLFDKIDPHEWGSILDGFSEYNFPISDSKTTFKRPEDPRQDLKNYLKTIYTELNKLIT